VPGVPIYLTGGILLVAAGEELLTLQARVHAPSI
jgi:hypothetical protein